MAGETPARLYGRVHDLEDGHLLESGSLTMTWVRVRDGKVVVSGLPVRASGEYELEEIEAGELHLVYINDILGIPAAVIPEEGSNEQAFHWSALSSIAPITGEVLAYDGVTHLAGIQWFGLRDLGSGEWAWPHSPTKDMGNWQAPPEGCAVPSGRTYEIVINRGPGFEGDTDNSELYVPPGILTGRFRRNSGTVCVGLVGASGHERMRFVGAGGSYVIRVVPYPGCMLVSLPCDQPYRVYAKPVAPPPDPPPGWAQCPPPPEQPWVLPCRPGAGSDRVDFQTPW
jgi:hypothetical protein